LPADTYTYTVKFKLIWKQENQKEKITLEKKNRTKTEMGAQTTSHRSNILIVSSEIDIKDEK